MDITKVKIKYKLVFPKFFGDKSPSSEIYVNNAITLTSYVKRWNVKNINTKNIDHKILQCGQYG